MRRPIGVVLTAVLFIVGLAACSEDRPLTGLAPEGPNAISTPPVKGPPCCQPPGPTARYSAITAGNDFTCVLTNSKTVYCWGRADSAQVGSNTNQACSSMIPCIPKPVIVFGGGDTLRATAIDAGGNHVCAIDAQGRAWCWGAGGSGQLGYPYGNGPMYASLVPGTSALTFRQISAGSTSTCGTTTNSGIWCWGELPLGVMSNLFQLTSDLSYTAVTVGAEHRCALKVTAVSSSVDCGGLNNQGQSAVDSVMFPTLAPFPTPTMFGTNVKDVSAGSYFTCADQRNGTVQCSGSNWHGQLGNGKAAFSNATPQTVGGGMLLHGVTTGRDHACALDNSGNAWCWGNSFWGDVGNDPSNTISGDFSTPQLVSGGHLFTALAAGGDHTCGTYFNALTNVNALYCWGINHLGQLGQGTWTSWFATPVGFKTLF